MAMEFNGNRVKNTNRAKQQKRAKVRGEKIAVDSKWREEKNREVAVVTKRQTHTDWQMDSPVPAQTGNSAKASDKPEVAANRVEKWQKT